MKSTLLSKKPMDIVIILIDTLRFDCIGYQPEKRHLYRYNLTDFLETPTLNYLGERGVCFTNAFSASTVTCPSISTIFTGLYPPKHGVRIHGVSKLKGVTNTLPEILRRHGYITVLFADNGILYDIPGISNDFDYKEYSANEKNLMSLLLKIKSEHKPVFLLYHVMDVHSPYLHTDEVSRGCNEDFYEEMKGLSKSLNIEFRKEKPWEIWNDIAKRINNDINYLFPLYVKGVTKFDKNRLRNFINSIDELINLDKNLFLILSDHGEGRCLEEIDTCFSHGGFLRDEIIRIPLIIIHPDYKHKIVDNLVSTVDIMPTILNLTNITPDLDYILDGDDLFNSRSYIYSEQWIHGADDPLEIKEAAIFQRCIRTEDKKYLLYGKPEDAYLNPGHYLQHGNNDEFIRQLSKDLFYITKYPEQIIKSNKRDLVELNKYREQYIEALNKKEKTREEIFLKILDIHKIYSKKLEVYESRNDFFEEKPINPFEDKNAAFESSIYLNKIISISNNNQIAGLKESSRAFKAVNIDYPERDDLEEKANKSIEIIKESVIRFGKDNIATTFTGGKDSTVLLHLIRRAFNGSIPFRVFNIDTSFKFKEIYEFRDKLVQIWNLHLIVLKNEDALKSMNKQTDHETCCYLLKTTPLNNAISKYNIKALMTAIRWDEQEARKEEEYLSRRVNHMRVQPILHFTEKDIWEYIRKYNIPYCSLYDRGYRSLGCEPCTRPSAPDGPERSGRSQDKEIIMKRLRELGYF